MGGELSVDSPGIGLGAAFTATLGLRPLSSDAVQRRSFRSGQPKQVRYYVVDGTDTFRINDRMLPPPPVAESRGRRSTDLTATDCDQPKYPASRLRHLSTGSKRGARVEDIWSVPAVRLSRPAASALHHRSTVSGAATSVMAGGEAVENPRRRSAHDDPAPGWPQSAGLAPSSGGARAGQAAVFEDSTAQPRVSASTPTGAEWTLAPPAASSAPLVAGNAPASGSGVQRVSSRAAGLAPAPFAAPSARSLAKVAVERMRVIAADDDALVSGGAPPPHI